MKELTTFDECLGDVIKGEIAIKGLRREDVARKLYVSNSSFNRMLNGKSQWKAEHLYNICKILDIYMEQICDKAAERTDFSWERLLRS